MITSKMNRFVVLIYSVSLYGAVISDKRWIGKSNTSHVKFWNSVINVGALTFNASMKYPLSVSRSAEYVHDSCELIYPLDMDDSEEHQFYTYLGKCLDEGLIEEMSRIHWLDPRNWDPSLVTIATPHSEMIPCSTDTVVISNSSDTVIILPPNPITVKTFRFGFKTLSRREYNRVSNASWFVDHFVLKSGQNLSEMFNITNSLCSERTGCMCGNSQYHDEICAFVKDDCSTALPCENPIIPFGHCCPICGSTILAQFNKEKFVYKKFNEVVKNYVTAENKDSGMNIVAYVSKVMNSAVQIIMMQSDGYNEKLSEIADVLEKFLEDKSKLGIYYCMTEHSGRIRGHRWYTLFTIFIVSAGVLLGGAFIVYLSKLKFLWAPITQLFAFAKFKRTGEDVKYERNADDKDVSRESSSDRSPQEVENVSKSDSGEGFSLIDTSG